MSMNVIRIPRYVCSVLRRLEDAGFEAYVVGGCVRDKLMGRRVNDYDVCTCAKPESVMELFPGAIPTGIRHGTVTVRSERKFIEITTFRSDGIYTDRRRPDSVRFLDNIRGDLARRDFTINAMAADIRGRITDPFGGANDIARRIIRSVARAETRLSEDALRMFRAVRFSAQLGFEIEPETERAIKNLSYRANKLSAERVRDELQKILLSPEPQKIANIVEWGLADNYIQNHAPADYSRLVKAGKSPRRRWAALTAVLYKAGCITAPEAFLRKLRLDRSTIDLAGNGAELAARKNISCVPEWKMLISENGAEAAKCAASAMDALYCPGHLKMVEDILSSGECVTLAQLAVNGTDMQHMGLSGKDIGIMLSRLLQHVILNPADNRQEKLIELAAQFAQL